MKIVSIEPTPSPHSMKVNLDESLPKGMQKTYTQDNMQDSPAAIQAILQIEGVKSVFHTSDFLAIERVPKSDWSSILAKAGEILGSDEHADLAQYMKSEEADAGFGEATVLVQIFRGIPMQIRVKSNEDEARIALPERFVNAAMKAGMASANLIKERKLEEWGVRYGDLQQIADEVAQEIDASYDEERIDTLIQQAEELGQDASETVVDQSKQSITADEVKAALKDEDWKVRYAALERFKPEISDLPVIAEALDDAKAAIRRLAVVYLGDLGKNDEVLPYLYQALRDNSVAVRRTAGDTLSDIGNPAASPAMIEALKDKNQLVRWRAARFLYEVGDDSALDALREAANDPEFEVSMQVEIALARIEQGKEAEGTVWQQMTNRNK